MGPDGEMAPSLEPQALLKRALEAAVKADAAGILAANGDPKNTYEHQKSMMHQYVYLVETAVRVKWGGNDD